MDELPPVGAQPVESVEEERSATPDERAARRRARAAKPPAILIRERLLKGSAWVLLGTALGSVVGIAVNGLLARLLSHPALGAYFLAFSMATFGGTLAQLGMERAVVRLVSASLGTDLPGRARKAVRIVFTFGVFGALVLAAVLVLGLGDFLATHVYHSKLVSTVMVFVAGWVIVAALQSLFAETFRGFQRFWLATLFNGLLSDVFLVTVFGLLYVRGVHPSLAQAVLVTIGVTAASLIAASLFLFRRYSALRGLGDIRTRDVLEVAWPLLVFNMATFMVGTGVDLWVVGAFKSQPDVALYAAATKLVFFVATPFIITSQVVPPIIAELWAQGKRKQLERSLREVATLAAIPAMLVLLVFLVAGARIMGLIYGSFFRAGAPFLVVLSLARLYAVVTGNCGAALMMTGHQRAMMGITLFTGVLSVTAEIVLVHLFGVIGVACATAGAQILQNSLQLAFARRRLGIWSHAELSLKPLRAMLTRSTGGD